MADEVALSPSQVRKDGQWRPIRRNTDPSHRSIPSISFPQRLSSLKSALKRRPLSDIDEDRALFLKSISMISLRVTSTLPYQPSARSHSSEHLFIIHPSPQLQQFQSVSDNSTEGNYLLRPKPYRTQSHWTAPPESYVPSGVPAFNGPTTVETSDFVAIDAGDPPEPEEITIDVDENLPRDAIAELFHRVEEYDQQHPENIKDAGKVWVRVNSVGHGLTKTFKNMGSLHKKRSLEPRLERGFSSQIVPLRSQIKIYEKPTRMKRIQIAVHDSWRKFRNRSAGRDTELQARKKALDNIAPFMSHSVISLTQSNQGCVRPQPRPRKLSRAPRLGERTNDAAGVRPARKDSKFSIDEQLKRRRPNLFLDTHSSDSSTYGP